MTYQEEFITFMVRSGVLTFGDFTTKSGRKTPYFINTGNYKTGAQAAIETAGRETVFVGVYGFVGMGEPYEEIMVIRACKLQCHLDYSEIGIGQFKLHRPCPDKGMLIFDVEEMPRDGGRQALHGIDDVQHIHHPLLH